MTELDVVAIALRLARNVEDSVGTSRNFDAATITNQQLLWSAMRYDRSWPLPVTQLPPVPASPSVSSLSLFTNSLRCAHMATPVNIQLVAYELRC
jgi:hypothetical protein